MTPKRLDKSSLYIKSINQIFTKKSCPFEAAFIKAFAIENKLQRISNTKHHSPT